MITRNLLVFPNMDTFDKEPFQAARKRLPWLIILLFLGMMTAKFNECFYANAR